MIADTSLSSANNSLTLYTLGAIFVVPLLIGVCLVGTNVDRTDQANQVSRDLASMYAQGMDFSIPANQKIAMRVASASGLEVDGGQAVLILSKIKVVREADCGSTPILECANQGYPVITQRYVIGNGSLRTSSFGSPLDIDSNTGEVRNWATDTSARVKGFSGGIKRDQYTYAAEYYLAAGESQSGVYSRAMF